MKYYFSERWSAKNLYLADADGIIIQLTAMEVHEINIQWSMDGGGIAFYWMLIRSFLVAAEVISNSYFVNSGMHGQ